MQQTGSQKALRVFSIIELIEGILAVIGAGLVLLGGFVIAQEGESVSAAGQTFSAGDAAALGVIAGVLFLLAGIFSIVLGIFGMRAAKDVSKIKPAYWLTYINFLFNLFTLIDIIFDGGAEASTMAVSIIGVVLSAVMWYLCFSLKRSYEDGTVR